MFKIFISIGEKSSDRHSGMTERFFWYIRIPSPIAFLGFDRTAHGHMFDRNSTCERTWKNTHQAEPKADVAFDWNLRRSRTFIWKHPADPNIRLILSVRKPIGCLYDRMCPALHGLKILPLAYRVTGIQKYLIQISMQKFKNVLGNLWYRIRRSYLRKNLKFKNVVSLCSNTYNGWLL